jgi:LysM repeat protein
MASNSSSGRGYVVRRGDTLSEIAASTGVSVAQLRAANGLRGNLINAGQKLQIPASGALASTATSQVAVSQITHRVNRGDTLWRIANRYGTSVEELRQANRKANDFLQVGQVLTISKG